MTQRIFLIFMVIMLIPLSFSSATEPSQSPALSLEIRYPEANSPDGIVYADVILNGFNDYLGGADFELKYDVSVLEFIYDNGNGVEINPDVLSELFKVGLYDNGTVRLASAADNNQNDESIPVEGVFVGTEPVKLASFAFYVHGSGQVNLDSVEFIKIVQPGNQLQEVTVSGCVVQVQPPQPTGGSVAGNAALEGLTDFSGIAVTLTGPQTYNTTTDQQGNYSFADVVPGTYTANFHRDKFLIKKQLNVVVQENINTPLSSVTLQSGDINSDNNVDISDLTILATAYRKAIGDPLYDSNADLNEDGQVDISDLTLLATNYRAVGD